MTFRELKALWTNSKEPLTLKNFIKNVVNFPEKDLEQDEFYYDDNEFIVFTEKYHLRRGYCCKSGCRHCPYGFDAEKSGK